MKTFNAKSTGKDGTEFFVRGWEPDGMPKGLVALIHGLGEHAGRYEHVATAFTDARYVLASFDLRGHGKSSGVRGHFPSLDAVMQDIKGFLVFLSQRYPDLPQFIYGHSLGGLLTLAYVLRSKPKFNGVIVTSAGLRSPLTEQKLKLLMVKLLGSLMPTTLLPSGLETAAISQDQSVVDRYNQDTLNHDRVSLAFGKAALSASDAVWGQAEEFSLPLLIMHGTGDRITYSHGSTDFAKAASKNNPDVTLKLWDGMYHELHNELVKEDVFQFMLEWLDRHL
jgi:alpha-beta hydrolase superfamily lysophospholipase